MRYLTLWRLNNFIILQTFIMGFALYQAMTDDKQDMTFVLNHLT